MRNKASNPDNDPNTQAKIIAYLIRKGANLEARDNGGEKPIECVRDLDNIDTRGTFVDAFQEAALYVTCVKETMMKLSDLNERQTYFDGAMEDDALYDNMLIGTRANHQERKFAIQEERRRAGQTTGNPMMASLVANEGGFAGAIQKQQEEKKKESCCLVM